MSQSGRITRSTTDRIIAGVCGGVARYLNVDPTLVRVGFVALTFFGVSPWVYLLLWIAVPNEASTAANFGEQVQQSVSEIEQRATQLVGQVADKVQHLGGSQSAATPAPPATTPPMEDKPATGSTTRL